LPFSLQWFMFYWYYLHLLAHSDTQHSNIRLVAFRLKVVPQAPIVKQEMLTFRSIWVHPPFCNGIRVSPSLVFYVVFCWLYFHLFVSFGRILSVLLWFKTSDSFSFALHRECFIIRAPEFTHDICGDNVNQSLNFCVIFCTSLLVFFLFSSGHFIVCPSILWLLIITLISSNISIENVDILKATLWSL